VYLTILEKVLNTSEVVDVISQVDEVHEPVGRLKVPLAVGLVVVTLVIPRVDVSPVLDNHILTIPILNFSRFVQNCPLVSCNEFIEVCLKVYLIHPLLLYLHYNLPKDEIWRRLKAIWNVIFRSRASRKCT
jgi:hypothetical protein